MSGDFNATLDHPQLRGLLDVGFRDAAAQAGAGRLATYPTDRMIPPVLSLDHVLTHDAGATDVTAYDLPGSDHRALVARIVLDNAP